MIWSLLPLAFVAELVDSSLGMGYGTSLAPILLLLGYSPAQVVPAVLISELLTGFWAAFWHERTRNIEWRGASLRVALLLGGLSIIGAIAAVFVASHVSQHTVRLYMAILVVVMGGLILLRRQRVRFSWGALSTLGVVAAFNKAISGGGYGPLVTSGQIHCGIGPKRAVAITSLAEGFTCLAGFVIYAIMGPVDLTLLGPLAVGAACSVPFAAGVVHRLPERRFTRLVGVAVLLLGVFSLWKVL